MLTNSPVVAKLLNEKARRRDWISSKIRISNRDNLENVRMGDLKGAYSSEAFHFQFLTHAYPCSHCFISPIV